MITSQVPNDCVVTALANYTGRTYNEVHELLEKVRSRHEGQGNGYFKSTWLFALACLLNRKPVLSTVPPLVDGIIRFRKLCENTGHAAVVTSDGYVVDGSTYQVRYTLEAYLRTFTHLKIDEVWR